MAQTDGIGNKRDLRCRKQRQRRALRVGVCALPFFTVEGPKSA